MCIRDRGRAILTQLLTVAEDRRTEISIILAGYKDDIENKLYAANPGVKSRFQRGEIMFEDYNEAELRRILLGMVHKHRWRLEDERVTNVVARRVARARGTKGFANARSMRIALEIAYQAAMQRAPGTTTYQTVDFIGERPDPATIPALQAALDELEGTTGLRQIKAAVRSLVGLAPVSYTHLTLPTTPYV